MAITTPKETIINAAVDPTLSNINEEDIQRITTNVANNIINTTGGRVFNTVQTVVNEITQVIQAIPGGNFTGAIQLNIGGKLSADLGFFYNPNTDVLTVANALVTNNVSTRNFIANGNVNLGNIANVKLAGGIYGSYVSTDGLGNLSWGNLNYANIENRPNLATVAISGNYNDLSNKPTIPTIPANISYFNNDSGYITSIGTINYNDLSNKPNLANVAISGSYNDLNDRPNIPSIAGLATQSDVILAVSNVPWTNVSNKPNFATVATSADYNDLINKPSIPSIVGLATETYVDTAVANLVDNAPTLLNTLNELANAIGNDQSFATSVSASLGNRLRIDIDNQNLTSTQKDNAVKNLGLANVAVTGSYLNLSNKPFIPPNNVSFFNNDIGYITLSSVTWSNVLSKPTFANVAFSADFNELNNVYSNTNAATYFETYTGNLSASHIVANGSQLTNLIGANVVGDVAGANHANIADIANSVSGSNVTSQVANSLVAGTVYTNAQPNITSVGTLSSLTVSGTANISGNLSAPNANLGNLATANYITGTLTTNAQPNITSLGLLTELRVDANLQSGNANLGNLAKASYIEGTLITNSQPNITSVGSLNLLNVVGHITSYSANLGNVVTANLFTGTLTTNAQPNITSVGTLINLSVVGNITTSGNLVTPNIYISSLGSQQIAIATTDGKLVGGPDLLWEFSNAALYAKAIKANLDITTQSNITASNANLGNLATANYITGTLTTNAQPNITSVGTLTSIEVSGTANITGNTTASNVYLSGKANIAEIEIRGQSLFSNVLLSGNISATNANLGNAVTANFFIGAGNNLSNIQFANINISQSQINNFFQANWTDTNPNSYNFIRNKPNITSTVISSVRLTDLGLPVGNIGQVLKSLGDGTYIFDTDLTGTQFGNYSVDYISANNTDKMYLPSGHNMLLNTTSGNITLDRNTQQSIKISDNLIEISVSGSTWTLDNTGNLQLPPGGTINDSDGLSVLGGGAGNELSNITFNSLTLNSTGTALNAGQGDILTNQVTGTKFRFLHGANSSILQGNAAATTDLTFTLPSTTGTNGQVLSTDGTGNLSWTAASGTTLYFLEAYASETYTLPGSFTEDVCRYSYISNTVNVPSGWFNTSTYTFTPQKAGYWEITASYDVYRNAEASMVIKKNTTIVASAGSFNAVTQQVTKIIYLNGSTDYIQIYNYGGAALSRSQYAERSWFQTRWVG